MSDEKVHPLFEGMAKYFFILGPYLFRLFKNGFSATTIMLVHCDPGVTKFSCVRLTKIVNFQMGF